MSGASSFQIRNVTVRGNGEAAVALSARDSAGRAANVLVFFASTGQQLREVSTGDFAGRVLFGPDDTLWAWGRRHDAQLESVNDHGVVRRYDANGLLRGESVSSASFGLAERSHVTADSMFAARRGQAVLVSWTANTAVWVDSNGKELRRQQLPQLSPGEFASGVSLSSNGGLIFSLQGRETARFVGLEQGATAWRPLPSLAGYAIVGTEADVPVTYGAGKMMVAQSLGASER